MHSFSNMGALSDLEKIERIDIVTSFLRDQGKDDEEDVIECLMEFGLECESFEEFSENCENILGMELEPQFKALFQAIRDTVDNVKPVDKTDGMMQIEDSSPSFDVNMGGERKKGDDSSEEEEEEILITMPVRKPAAAKPIEEPEPARRERSRSRSPPKHTRELSPIRATEPVAAAPSRRREVSPIRPTAAPSRRVRELSPIRAATAALARPEHAPSTRSSDNKSSAAAAAPAKKVVDHEEATRKWFEAALEADLAEPSIVPAEGKKKKRGAITGITLEDETDILPLSNGGRAPRAVVHDYDRWELDRLRAANVRDRDHDANERGIEFSAANQEEVDIEVKDCQPVFMRGLPSKSGPGKKRHARDMEPVKVVAVPDGSLTRAAEKQVELAKERRIQQDHADQELQDSVPKDFNRPWEDPAPAPGERLLAATLQGITKSARPMNAAFGAQAQGHRAALPAANLSFGPRSNLTMKQQRESLPIFPLRNDFIRAVRENQVLVVVGETGSGKTTQMTQYLMEEGIGRKGCMIACTQPRRVAAQSIAKRVAEEVGCPLGAEVGYAFRYEDMTSRDTVIKYMTDGLLLKEAVGDPMLSRYQVIILDEAHERTLSTDVLFGLLKQSLRRRKDLKVIVTSATLNEEKFSKYFFDAPVFKFPGRTHPVLTSFAKDPVSDYLEAALSTVMEIHLKEPPGDILVFLTGKDEIDTACETLNRRMERIKDANPPPLLLYPAYSSLPSELQTAIFDPTPPGCRKCVVATNIAEASLTIDGIFYVVDPGFAKVKMYNPRKGMESLQVVPISQANARQRAGRAGRTGPGKCYRLYTEHAFLNEMLPNAIPEILRTNLSTVVLSLKAMGVVDLFAFEFMDPPSAEALSNAMLGLFELGALDEEGLLTPSLGRRMAEFPLDPPLSKTLLTSVDLGCAGDVLTIVSMLQATNVFYRPRDRQTLADTKKAKFHRPEGDHLTLLEVYRAWEASRYSSSWCFENFIQQRAMREAKEARAQIIGIMDRLKLATTNTVSVPAGAAVKGENLNQERRILKALCAGYFRHACRRDKEGEGYRTLLDNEQVFIHPSSALHRQQPEYIVYHELVLTTKEYLRDVSVIDPKWLPQLAPQLFAEADGKKMSKHKRSEKIEPLHNRFQEKDAWRLSKRQW